MVISSKKKLQRKEHSMNKESNYNKWTNFITDSKRIGCFKSNEEVWKENLDKLKKFIDNNDKTPSSESKNKEEKKILGY